jgi:hypothetical protein
LQYAFPDSVSLKGMLDHFLTNNQLPSSVFDYSPMLVYLRSSFQGIGALESNTLASLGLGGQSVRFQLRFTIPFSSLSSSDASCALIDKQKGDDDTSSSQQEPMIKDNVEKKVEGESLESAASASPAKSNTSLSPSLPQPPPAPPLTEEDYILLNQTEAEESEKKKQKQQQQQKQQEPQLLHFRRDDEEDRMEVDNNPFAFASAFASASASLLSPQEVMKRILFSNFDIVSKPALITLTKYLLNVSAAVASASLFDKKYRSIKMENKVFQEKVLPCKGSLEFLLSIGFQEKKSEKILEFFSASSSLSSSADKRAQKEDDRTRSNGLLEEGIDLLYQAMKELDIPVEDQPQRKPRDTALASQPQQPIIPFDPFKPLMINASSLSSSQALTARTIETEETEARKGKSTTETQLEQLRRKRRELEGIPSSIERKTEILFPVSSSSSAASSSSSVLADSKSPRITEGREEEGSSVVASSASYLPKSVIQKLLLSGNDEGPPLTTAATRELQKLQNEKVYTETVIRIRSDSIFLILLILTSVFLFFLTQSFCLQVS